MVHRRPGRGCQPAQAQQAGRGPAPGADDARHPERDPAGPLPRSGGARQPAAAGCPTAARRTGDRLRGAAVPRPRSPAPRRRGRPGPPRRRPALPRSARRPGQRRRLRPAEPAGGGRRLRRRRPRRRRRPSCLASPGDDLGRSGAADGRRRCRRAFAAVRRGREGQVRDLPRCMPGEALYSSVVIRFTGRLQSEDVRAIAGDIAGAQRHRRRHQHPDRLPGADSVRGAAAGVPAANDPRRLEYEVEQRLAGQFKNEVQARGLDGVTVILDAGHGGIDVGASMAGVWESLYVYDIALRVKRTLETETRATVEMTTRDGAAWTIADRDVLPFSRGHSVLTTPPFPITDTDRRREPALVPGEQPVSARQGERFELRQGGVHLDPRRLAPPDAARRHRLHSERRAGPPGALARAGRPSRSRKEVREQPEVQLLAAGAPAQRRPVARSRRNGSSPPSGARTSGSTPSSRCATGSSAAGGPGCRRCCATTRCRRSSCSRCATWPTSRTGALLTTRAFRQRVAASVVDGLLSYFGARASARAWPRRRDRSGARGAWIARCATASTLVADLQRLADPLAEQLLAELGLVGDDTALRAGSPRGRAPRARARCRSGRAGSGGRRCGSRSRSRLSKSIGRARPRSRCSAASREFRYSCRSRADLYSKFSRRSPIARASSIALRLAGISTSARRLSSSALGRDRLRGGVERVAGLLAQGREAQQERVLERLLLEGVERVGADDRLQRGRRLLERRDAAKSRGSVPPESARARRRPLNGPKSSLASAARICCARRSGFRPRSASSSAARSASQVKTAGPLRGWERTSSSRRSRSAGASAPIALASRFSTRGSDSRSSCSRKIVGQSSRRSRSIVRARSRSRRSSMPVRSLRASAVEPSRSSTDQGRSAGRWPARSRANQISKAKAGSALQPLGGEAPEVSGHQSWRAPASRSALRRKRSSFSRGVAFSNDRFTDASAPAVELSQR